MTHSAGNTVGVEGVIIPTEIVENYSIVERDDPIRPAVYASGDLYTSLSTSRETDFDFNFFDFFLPVNGGPPPHYHPFEHEIWHVTDGEFQFNLGDIGELGIVVPEGTTVFGPIDRTHGYRNLDSTASAIGVTPGARTLSMTTPGALDLFFESAAISVTDRDAPIPVFEGPVPQDFINLAKFSVRTNAGIALLALDPDYQPPEDALDYVLVLPEDATGEVVEQAIELKDIDGFNVWTTGEQEGLPQRPTFTGEFGIEYTSLTSLEESGNKFAYNLFELAAETTDISISADLSGLQVVEPTESSATGNVTLELNDAGDIKYSLTVTGLDFGELVESELAQTPENELDDVTKIHIHAGESGTNGSHAFNILDPNEQQESDLSITLNDDGSTTISGVWNQSEQEIPEDLSNFIEYGGAPESDYYFQVHTTGNETGEIRGQIALETATEFPDPVISQEHQLFYVNEGRLAVKINGEVEIAERDTYVHIAPENEYAIANFGNETVEALSISIPTVDEPDFTQELFPSPIIPLGDIPTNQQVFLDDEANFFNKYETRRQVFAGGGDDEIYAVEEDEVFGEAGDDFIDASGGLGRNRLYGNEGDDTIFVNKGDRAFGGNGNDFINAAVGANQPGETISGGNYIDGGNGEDYLLAGSNSELHGGNGNDTLQILAGSGNLLYGEAGSDEFWIANGRLPDAVAVEYPEGTDALLPEGISLPELVDTRNTIMDFELGVDRIYVSGIEGVSSFEDLQLLPAFGDLGSTSIVAEFIEDGTSKEISLANVAGIIFNELSADDFIFA